MEKFFKFAVCLMVVSSTAFANSSNLVSSPVVVASEKGNGSKLLGKGVEKEFEVYMLDNAKRFTKSNEWSDFLNVVTLYTDKPTALLKLNATQRKNFSLAVLKLNEKLDKIGGEEAKVWKDNVNFTTRVINFLWSFDMNNLVIPNVESENIEVSTMVPSL